MSDLFIVLLLLLILVALIVLFLQNRQNNANENQATLLMKNQEAITKAEANDQHVQYHFQNIQNQIQSLRQEQSASYQQMDQLQAYMENMNRIMTNTKARGSWGEYQLEALLQNYCGSNPEIFTMQYTLENGKIADAILHLPDTDKLLCIDSKFPMENFVSGQEKQFAINVKKHIHDIADKYITPQP